MNKIIKIAAASASASAWWGGPMTSFTDEFFGDGVADGAFNMNMNANANTHAYSRGNGYGYNRYYQAPYGYPSAPVGLIRLKRKSLGANQISLSNEAIKWAGKPI